MSSKVFLIEKKINFLLTSTWIIKYTALIISIFQNTGSQRPGCLKEELAKKKKST